MLIGALVAGAICTAGVWGTPWFYTPLGITSLLAAVLVVVTWLRRRLRTHDPPTVVASACVAAAFLIAFAVTCELLAEIQHARGYGIAPSPSAIHGARPLERMWQRGVLPIFRPRGARPTPRR